MTQITETLAADLLADMRALADIYDCGKREGEFTAGEYKKALKISYDKANNWLNKALADGKVTARQVGKIIFYKIVKTV